MRASSLVLVVHAVVSLALIGVGAGLIASGSIGQDTFLAMISGALGLLSGGGTALALEHSISKTP